jgi:hypothetical protein
MSKDFISKPSFQYNAIMLIRILSDNPGRSFTRNMDKKFVDTAKELLRSGRDPSVRQMLMETLDTFEFTKMDDEGVSMIVEMWKKEKERAYKTYGVSGRLPNSPVSHPRVQYPLPIFVDHVTPIAVKLIESIYSIDRRRRHLALEPLMRRHLTPIHRIILPAAIRTKDCQAPSNLRAGWKRRERRLNF